MEGYFRASYAPLGGSRIWREKASSTSMKLCFSMFGDKPPCIPLCFGTVDYTARGGRGFFFFLSLCSNNFFYTLQQRIFPQLFLLAFLFPLVPVLSVFFFSSSSYSFSLTQFSAWMGYVNVLGSVFSLDGFCNCFRLSFQPGWVMYL